MSVLDTMLFEDVFKHCIQTLTQATTLSAVLLHIVENMLIAAFTLTKSLAIGTVRCLVNANYRNRKKRYKIDISLENSETVLKLCHLARIIARAPVHIRAHK